MHLGPGYISPLLLSVDNATRSRSSLEGKKPGGPMDAGRAGREHFPARTLARVRQRKARILTTPRPAPHLVSRPGYAGLLLTAGGFAYLHLRTILVMMIWNFELKKTPDRISGWLAVKKLARLPSTTLLPTSLTRPSPSSQALGL
ncbi:hypothetical protein FOPE_08377 [Fonsecaea pedrosoi]|nr:hypothetical protein FOPE_08377 [Fonsecaea pedrosoi]